MFVSESFLATLLASKIRLLGRPVESLETQLHAGGEYPCKVTKSVQTEISQYSVIPMKSNSRSLCIAPPIRQSPLFSLFVADSARHCVLKNDDFVKLLDRTLCSFNRRGSRPNFRTASAPPKLCARTHANCDIRCCRGSRKKVMSRLFL